MNKDKAIIPNREYQELKDRDLFFTALEHSGVDNWEGYERAQELFDEWKGD